MKIPHDYSAIGENTLELVFKTRGIVLVPRPGFEPGLPAFFRKILERPESWAGLDDRGFKTGRHDVPA